MDNDVVTQAFCNVKHKRIEEIVIPTIQRMETQLKNIDIAIRGNGQPGLKADVRDLKKKQLELEQKRYDSGWNLRFLIGLAIMLLVAAPAATALSMLVRGVMQ